MIEDAFLIAGLGNPGSKYAANRHNLGFLIVDELVQRWGARPATLKYQAEYTSITVAGVKIHCLKPQTFMNRSGISISECCRFFKLAPKQLLVIHDDLDLMPGRLKLVPGGGPGGHNGIKSIIERLGTKDFYRLKIGIGRPGTGEVHRDFPVDRYVLSDLGSNELKELTALHNDIETGLKIFIKESPSKAMTYLNSLN